MALQDQSVCIVDYGSGNVSSVFNIFKDLHKHVKISNSACDLEAATHIVLPGVGAFGSAMEKIKSLSIIDLLEENVLKRKKPFLGICVGMQILADTGYEHGTFEGLGWISGETKKINTDGKTLPHVGWNNSRVVHQTALLEGISEEMDFYFVNSFFFEPEDKQYVNAVCSYGQDFASVVSKGNIFGVQFHPEKSQKAGKILLNNFLNIE